MHLIPAALLLVILAGCAAPVPINYQQMSAEQIKAMAADKSMLVICTVAAPVLSFGGGKTVYVQQDARVAKGATSISTDADCSIVVTTKP